MPPTARLSRCALTVLDRHVQSNRCCGTFQKNSPQSCMENSNAAVAGDPNEGSGLSNRRSQWHRINPLEDWIDPAHVWDRCVSGPVVRPADEPLARCITNGCLRMKHNCGRRNGIGMISRGSLNKSSLFRHFTLRTV